MKHRLISAGVLTIVSMLSTSCQKSTADQFMDVQHEIIALLNVIKDPVSAEQYADKLSDLYRQEHELQKAMDTQERRHLWASEEFSKVLFRKEPLKNNLVNKDYYGSQKLKQVLTTDPEYILP